MFNISGFLERFRKFDQGKTLQAENVARKIQGAVDFGIGKDNFVIKDGILYVRGSPALRQEIFLRKEQLLPLVATDGIFDIR
jgi:hypothetical protein